MLFNSLQFLFFFVFITITYFRLPHRQRWILLLLGSCYFYMVFKPIYILILIFTIVIDYFAGIFIENAQGKRRKMFLLASLVANIGVLAVFKYYNFLNLNLTHLLGEFHRHNPVPFLSILLPIGLSFHTFQAMSYTIEVYRGNQKAERHFGIYSLYVMFYPQLVAGPIERPQNVLHQLHEPHPFDHQRLQSGLMKIAEGFFKKVVIADRLSWVVNHSFNHIQQENGLSLLVATVFFTFQIYCDFSGYSDIAIGTARILGIDLMKNFNHPYLSRSIGEFWSRWHISLSTWFRDYLYIPLGGNRVAVPRFYFNIFIVFMISGLWHGANWTFVIWGALHGSFLVVENIRKKWWPSLRLPGALQWLLTFLLVCITWVFFRAASVQDAFLVLRKIFTLSFGAPLHTPFNLAEMIFCILLIALLLLKEKRGWTFHPSGNLAFYSSLAGIALVIYFFGVFNYTQFIYFQF